MGNINTVAGVISSMQLGVTYAHEHLITHPPQFVVNEDPDLCMNDIEKAVEELNLFSMAGGTAMVEMTTVDYGRNIHALRTIASRVPVHIIAPTGFLKGIYHTHLVRDKTIDQLADVMIREVTEGINGTDSKAGVIKAGTGHNDISNDEEKVLRAAARAQIATGAAISTHTEAGTMGLGQVKIFQSEGVEMEKVIIGHLDRNLDWDYHHALAKEGVYLLYDNVSKEQYHPDSLRIEFIQRLIQKGYGKRVMLSGDFGRKSYFLTQNGGPGYTYILWRFIPWLRKMGISKSEIDDLLVNNPRAVFAISK